MLEYIYAYKLRDVIFMSKEHPPRLHLSKLCDTIVQTLVRLPTPCKADQLQEFVGSQLRDPRTASPIPASHLIGCHAFPTAFV